MSEAIRIRELLAPVAAEFVTAVTTDTNGTLVTAASAKMGVLSNIFTQDNTSASSYDNITTSRILRPASTINSSVIMQLKNKGDTILNIAGIVYTGYVIGTAYIKGGAATVPRRIWDFASGTVTGLATVLETIGIMIFTTVMGLVTLGVMLAVIIPMTPFMIWTMGIAGLMVLIIESLVASVLWAVMIMHPSGEGIMSDHSRQGLMILLMLFARPALMLIGMEAGIFMMDPLVDFVNDMFAFVFKST